MAISHLGTTVNVYKEDGSWIEIECTTEGEAASLAHDLLDVFAEMTMRLKEEEEDEPIRYDRGVPYKVRVTRT